MGWLHVFALSLGGSVAVAGHCRAQAPGVCELLVVSSRQQVIELRRTDYVLTATKIGWDLKILNPEIQQAVGSLDSPDISFCAGGLEVLARGNDALSSAVPAGATAFYSTRHRKIYPFASGVIPIMAIGSVVRK